MNDVEMIQVTSSNISSVGYIAEKKTLVIEFKPKGTQYSYYPISKADYDALMDASSIGSFFARHIKKNPGITATKL